MENKEILKELLSEEALIAYENIKEIISEIDNVGSIKNLTHIPNHSELDKNFGSLQEKKDRVLPIFCGIIIEANKILSKLTEEQETPFLDYYNTYSKTEEQ